MALKNPRDVSHRNERQWVLEGAKNLRDVGGLFTADGRKVHCGLLFRSDALSRLTDADLEIVDSMELRTVVDLRTHNEKKSRPDRLPVGANIRPVHLPMRDPSIPDSLFRMSAFMILHGPAVDFAEILRRQYHAYAFHCTEAVGAMMRLAAEPTAYPMVVHCAAGKDRTGFVIAVLLLSIGVSMEAILDDYLLTNECLASSIPRYTKSIRRLSLGRVSAEQLQPLFTVRAETLEEVLAKIADRYGSIQGWLEQACGIDRALLRRIEAQLLNPPPGAADTPM